jgi:hypothetical protein
MEAQRLLDAAPFPSDVIKVLKQAFNEAWWIVAAKIPQDRIDVTRVALAHAVIAHAIKGERDVAALTASALDAVRRHPPR